MGLASADASASDAPAVLPTNVGSGSGKYPRHRMALYPLHHCNAGPLFLVESSLSGLHTTTDQPTATDPAHVSP